MDPQDPVEKPIPNIRTLRSDVADAVQKDNISAFKIALAEQKRGDAENQIEQGRSPANKRNIILLSLSLLCILIACGVGGYLYYQYTLKIAPKEVVIAKNIITVNQTQNISFSGFSNKEVIQNINNTRERFIGQNQGKKQIFQIVPTMPQNGVETKISLASFFEFFEMSPPSVLTRNINDYIFGYSLNASTSVPFLILKTDTYEQIFASMLTWEATIPKQFSSLFGPIDEFASFTDVTIHNRDSRVITSQGKTQLLYSFIDSNTLVITKDPDSLDQITDAYLLSQRVQ